jgi:hypothetical protein
MTIQERADRTLFVMESLLAIWRRRNDAFQRAYDKIVERQPIKEQMRITWIE